MRAFLSLFLPLLISSLHAEKIITNPNWVARNTPVVTVDSILLRDTVSRMYITLKQLPHTSLTIHDDWVVQDSIKRFSGKVRDIDGVDFDRIFQFDSDSTIHIEMDFPALPPSLTEVDIIGNQKSNEIRIIGLSLTEKRNKTSIYPQPNPIYRSATPAITFDTDTAILQGKFVGYHKRLNLPDGKIILDDENLLQMSARQVAQRVAFVAQNVPSTQMTVHDMVMLGRRPYMKWGFTEDDHQIVHHAMAQLRIEPLRGRFLNELSGGERQKVMLARALAQQPKLLLLDEPTSSLDIQNQYQVLQIVRDICHEQHLTAIVVIHDLNLALRFCDRFVLLRQGGVYACGGKEVLDRDALRDVYHVDAEVVAVQKQSIVLVDEKDATRS